MQHRPDEFSYIYPIKTDELKDSENACIKRIAENHFYIEPFSDSKDALQQDLHRANFKINMILPEDKSKYERIEMAYRQECVSIGGSAFISALGATGNSLMVRAGSIENILDVKAGALISKQGDFSVFTVTDNGPQFLFKVAGSIEAVMKLVPVDKDDKLFEMKEHPAFLFKLDKVITHGLFLHDLVMQKTLPDINLPKYKNEVDVTVMQLRNIWEAYQTRMTAKVIKSFSDEKNIDKIVAAAVSQDNNAIAQRYQRDFEFKGAVDKYQAAKEIVAILNEKPPLEEILRKCHEKLEEKTGILSEPRTDFRRSSSKRGFTLFSGSKGKDAVLKSKEILDNKVNKETNNYKYP